MTNAYRSSEPSTAPFSGAREANGFVFVSGQVHVDAAGALAGSTTEEKLELVINNVQGVLREAGLDLGDIVSVRLFLIDLSELPALNAAYVKRFSHPLPARTTVGVAALPIGASLEMDAIAVRRS